MVSPLGVGFEVRGLGLGLAKIVLLVSDYGG